MTFVDVLRAKRRIAPYVRRTPFVKSLWLSDLSGGDVWLKLESLQLENSFKARGAFNAVLARLERSDPPARLVTASAGNHGRALAAAAAAFGIPLVVFTPSTAPAAKLDAIRRHGATLRDEAATYEEAERRAKAFAATEGADFISPYSDEDVIAGAATVGVEVLEDAPSTGIVLVPIGGGGLVAGVALAAAASAPACEVVGIELEVSSAFQASLRAGRLVEIAAGESIADGLGGNPDPDTITFAYIKDLVDRIETVTEDDLRSAIGRLVEFEHLVAEGAGAAGVAAVLHHRVDVRGRRAAVIVTGSNIDRARLAGLL